LPKCASQNDWEKVRQLLRELGMEAIDSRDSGGCTVMHWAVRYGKTQFVKVRPSERSGALPGRRCGNASARRAPAGVAAGRRHWQLPTAGARFFLTARARRPALPTPAATLPCTCVTLSAVRTVRRTADNMAGDAGEREVVPVYEHQRSGQQRR